MVNVSFYSERLRLVQALNELPGPQFDQLVFALNPPQGILPPISAAQGLRTTAILEWAESPAGPGLETLHEILSILFAYPNRSVPEIDEVGRRIQKAVKKGETELNLSGLGLLSVPDSVGQLANLSALDLSNNRIDSIPKSLKNLSNLTQISLSGNQFKLFPKELTQIRSLRVLIIHDNQFPSLPREIGGLVNLTQLYLQGNKSLSLPDELLGSTWEDVKSGALATKPKRILEFYFRTLLDSRPLNEAKLITVGFGAVGKTSIIDRLVNGEFNPDSQKTSGIKITSWPIFLNGHENIKLHVWDFGGQEIMHSTHQFFLTDRSLYLLVLNGRQGYEDTDAEYWLELIQSFGGTSPIIIVLNRSEEHPFDVNRRALQEKFPAIRDFVQTDCKSGMGIKLLQSIIEREINLLEHLRDSFPANWIGIKDKIASMKNNYITFEEYRSICEEYGESDFKSQDSLAVYLRGLGIALNYKDDPRLQDTHILNPKWVTQGIYTILNDKSIALRKGEVKVDELSQILPLREYPPERHIFLLELMRKFELCFRFQDDENLYLVPELLDKQQPPETEEFNLSECLTFRYEYPILPEGLLPRFIVRTHTLSKHYLRWRTGVILSLEGNRALVKADQRGRCITISVDGPFISRRRLLAIIRADFERIHNSFSFKPRELVPVPGQPNITIRYKELLLRENQGLTSLQVFADDDTFITLNVRELLNGVDLEGTRQPSHAMERHSQALRLFYSYSHKDETLRDELEVHLKLLQRQGLIQPWHDRRILAGTEWAGEIDGNLNRADIILLLISADFIASDYCYDLEMTRAIERHASGEAKVIPIILRPTDWQNTPFSKLQFLPKDAKAVTAWGDRDAAWLNVETGIKQLLEAMRADKRF
ncbi:TIR domain-containing protein [bacterium]|nr:TIR domain-containing protein [bacterium]